MIFPGWELDIAQASSIQTGNSDVMGVEFPKYRELFFELLIVFRHMASSGTVMLTTTVGTTLQRSARKVFSGWEDARTKTDKPWNIRPSDSSKMKAA